MAATGTDGARQISAVAGPVVMLFAVANVLGQATESNAYVLTAEDGLR